MCTVDQDRARARLQLLNRGNIRRDLEIKQLREELNELREKFLSLQDNLASVKATHVLSEDDGK